MGFCNLSLSDEERELHCLSNNKLIHKGYSFSLRVRVIKMENKE
jgi:hypothetical protein